MRAIFLLIADRSIARSIGVSAAVLLVPVECSVLLGVSKDYHGA